MPASLNRENVHYLDRVERSMKHAANAERLMWLDVVIALDHGVPADSIAATMGCHRATVYRRLRAAGVPEPMAGWPTEEA